MSTANEATKQEKVTCKGSELKVRAVLDRKFDIVKDYHQYAADHTVDKEDVAPKTEKFKGGIMINDFYRISWFTLLEIRKKCETLAEILSDEGIRIGRLGGEHGGYKGLSFSEWNSTINKEWPFRFSSSKEEIMSPDTWLIVQYFVQTSFNEGRKEWLLMKH